MTILVPKLELEDFFDENFLLGPSHYYLLKNCPQTIQQYGIFVMSSNRDS